MKQPITMPALSDTMNNGRLSKWLKQPGDKIKTGEAIAEVETDKAIMEVEAFHDGYLAGPLAAVNTELPVGQTIGFIADTVAEAAAAAAPAAKAEAPASAAAPANTAAAKPAAVQAAPVKETTAAAAAAPAAAESAPVSPILAAAIAHRPHGRRVPSRAAVAEATRPAAAAAAPSKPSESSPSYRLERLSPLRDSVARNMIASAAAPTFHVTAQLPLAPLMNWAKDKKLSFTVALARACARAIAENPLFNASYTDEGLAHFDQIDIGIAVDMPDGLITPVLRDVGQRSITDLAGDWSALLDKTKSRRLQPSDYRGATFYLSNLGTFAVVRSFDSIVPVGASAILSVGASAKDGALLTLSCDHRVVFGGDAARFLQTLSEWIANPEKLA
ncbi:MAG TPA: dihydrolipoamide acetyltransferase family protein [Bradyrhizobium sp.]|nr:dihydrolipoamide acetyltransferase family protein [Bradyrhizobium sp.]